MQEASQGSRDRFSRAFPMTPAGAILLAWALGVSGCALLADSDEAGHPSREQEAEVPEDLKTYAVRLGRRVLETYFEQGRDEALRVSLSGAPPAASEPGPLLYVTIRNQGVLRGRRSGGGDTFLEAVNRGVVNAIEDDRFGERIRAVDTDAVRLEYDAVFQAELLDGRGLELLSSEIEPGRHAFQFTRDGHGAFFAASEMLTRNYSQHTAFEELCVAAELEAECYARQETVIERFRTEHWLEDPGEPQGYIELFRGHRIVGTSDVRVESIERATRANADYFVNHQTDRGAFDYQYQPDVDELVQDDNTVRQAGASYAASKLAARLGDETYVEMARRAVDNLLAYEHPLRDGSCLIWQSGDLGVTALGLLGLVELQHPAVGEDYRGAAVRLARGIASQQTPEGRLLGRFGSTDDPDSLQQYFPGEALLALVRTLRRWPEEGWILGVLERAFDYYQTFWRERGEGAFVPWQAAAWANTYLLTDNERYAEFVFELADWTVAQQNLSTYGSWTQDDYAGAFASPVWGPPSCGSATLLEAIPLAIEVARRVGDEERRSRYLVTERHALRFVLQLLITESETFYMPAPALSLGGVRLSLIDNDVRIDAVQHASTAFLHALEFLRDEPLAWGDPNGR